MGVTFRSGGYIKQVRFGGRTIKDGEAAAIWNAKGVHREMIGPQRVWLINSTIRFLTRNKAESHQFLRISHRDGRVEHIEGPAVLYENPAYHDNVCVQDGYRLNSSSECVVAFTSSSSSNQMSTYFKAEKGISDQKEHANCFSRSYENAVSKRIIRGPTLFTPNPTEHVHKFAWSTFSPSQNGNERANFEILRTSGISSIMTEVPTVDGFSFNVSLILSYTATSIDKLLDNHDPMKNLKNGLLFDSQTLGQSFPSDVLKTKKEDVVAKLSNMSSYPSLTNAASKCGLEIDSIQVITLTLCSALCEQIQKEQVLSANIRSKIAEKEHSCKIRNMELEDQRNRLEEEAALKKKQILINDKLDAESFKFKLAALERRTACEKYEAESTRDAMKVKEESILDFLNKMKHMGVDMTKFMTTYGGMEVANKVIGKSDVLKMNYGDDNRTAHCKSK